MHLLNLCFLLGAVKAHWNLRPSLGCKLLHLNLPGHLGIAKGSLWTLHSPLDSPLHHPDNLKMALVWVTTLSSCTYFVLLLNLMKNWTWNHLSAGIFASYAKIISVFCTHFSSTGLSTTPEKDWTIIIRAAYIQSQPCHHISCQILGFLSAVEWHHPAPTHCTTGMQLVLYLILQVVLLSCVAVDFLTI